MNFHTTNISFDINTNGYHNELILKRELTFEEVIYIADDILHLDTGNLFDDDEYDEEQIKDYKERYKKEITSLLEGYVEFYEIDEDLTYGVEPKNLSLSTILDIIIYLKKQNVI